MTTNKIINIDARLLFQDLP